MIKINKNDLSTTILFAFGMGGPILFILFSVFLGLASPNYDSLKHTLSRLLILKYGNLQQLNFFQFALSMLVSGHLLSESMKSRSCKMFITRSAAVCFSLLVFVALFTPDNIDNFLVNVWFLTPGAVLHIFAVISFILISPFGISRLVKLLRSEKNFRSLAGFTALVGYGAFTLSIIWLALYYKGWLWNYKGLFQKIIAVLVIFWLEAMLAKASKKTENLAVSSSNVFQKNRPLLSWLRQK